LYGLNYIHSEGLLHRDISLQNVLLKVFASGAVLVKLSDFGLVKDRTSEYTRTHTELRGTIRDPLLESFKDYDTTNEIYAIGVVLCFIFTGRESLRTDADEVGRIVRKCVDHDADKRYASVRQIIADVEAVVVTTPTEAPA
jgi:serine/threonine protein kinase